MENKKKLWNKEFQVFLGFSQMQKGKFSDLSFINIQIYLKLAIFVVQKKGHRGNFERNFFAEE